MANAGIDHSNLPTQAGGERVLLLPEDPDSSALALRERLVGVFGTDIAVILSDRFCRPWRKGTVRIGLGAAGLPALIAIPPHPHLFLPQFLLTPTPFPHPIPP